MKETGVHTCQQSNRSWCVTTLSWFRPLLREELSRFADALNVTRVLQDVSQTCF